MMQSSSFASTRSFFKSGKFRSRKQKQPQDLTTSLYTSRNASIDTTHTASSAWTTPATYRPIPSKVPHPHQYSELESNPQSSRQSDDTMREPVKVLPPFLSLPTARSISPGLLDEDEYRALGLKTPDIHRANGSRSASRNTSRDGSRGTSPARGFDQDASDGIFEMETPMQGLRDRRPELQVRIPANTPARSPRLPSARHGGPTPLSALSTPSSMPTGRHLKSGTTAPTPYSIVSPLTAIDGPKARRPFSTESFEAVIQQGTPTPHRLRAPQQMERSRRTSISSPFEAETPRPGETPIVKNATAMKFDSTNLYHAALVSGANKQKKEKSVVAHTSPPMHRKGSAVSISANININKPLPPEPPPGANRPGTSPMKQQHIAFSATEQPARSQRPSRSNSTTIPPERVPHYITESTSPERHREEYANAGRRNSQSSMVRSSTLRSKFTPKDLDSMDEVFQRRTANNSAYQTPIQSQSRTSPEQSQLSLAETNYLSTIVENSPRSSRATMSILEDPLQISRGPMRMEPTRRPPQPPPQPLRVHNVELDRTGRKRQPMTRSHSSNSIHTISTTAHVPESPQRRPTTRDTHTERRYAERRGTPQSNGERRPSVGFANEQNNDRRNLERMTSERVSKADRVLGMLPSASASMPRAKHEPQPAVESSSEEESDQDFYEIRGKQDVHVEEIHNRLKLLSPREDPNVAFDAFRERQTNIQWQKYEEPTTSVKEKAQAHAKPTIEEKLHLTGTLQDNPIVPSFIAELEADRVPSPVELQGSDLQMGPLSSVPEESGTNEFAELGVPSPETIAAIPIPPEPVDEPQRRGRNAGTNPTSTVSLKTKSLHSARSVRVKSLASIAASDIPDYYANSPTPNTHSKRPSTAGSEYEDVITADAAEEVLLHILQSLDNLEDLFAAALVSKGFYRTFKRHELYLLKHAIWKMSPAAWELREMSVPYDELEPPARDYTPSLYFRYYVQDLLAMVELKAMILESCRWFLRAETISGLGGETERSPMIDEAFWRVWTFCRIFGCKTGREEDIVGQMDWLRGGVVACQSSNTRTLAFSDELARNSVLYNPPTGFARGNGRKGLSAEELHDMTEIWLCLGVLVRGYHGKREEAREFGVFAGCNIPKGDVARENAMLEEWTHYLLTQSPTTVLDVTSPAVPTRTQFVQVRSQGYTLWKPPRKGMSRSTFLKEAVTRVYAEKMGERRVGGSALAALPIINSATGAGVDAAMATKARIAQHAAEIRKQKEDPNYRNVPVSDDRPLSNYSDILDRLEAISAAAVTDAPPMPKLPGLAARLSRAKSRSASVANATLLRPASPTSTIHSSSPSMGNSLTALDNGSVADVASTTSSGKQKSRLKHPFQRKHDQSILSHSPSKAGGAGRFSALRSTNKLLEKTRSKREKSKQSSSVEELPRSMPPSDEKFAVLSEDQLYSTSSLSSELRDPVDLAVEKLTRMGFDRAKAVKALADTDSGNGIDFDVASAKLKKERERQKRLERLDTMG